MAEDGHTGGDSAPGSRGEGDSNGHPVRQVVNAVTQDDHPGHARHVAGGGVEVGVGVAVAVVGHLVLRDDHLLSVIVLLVLGSTHGVVVDLQCVVPHVPGVQVIHAVAAVLLDTLWFSSNSVTDRVTLHHYPRRCPAPSLPLP